MKTPGKPRNYLILGLLNLGLCAYITYMGFKYGFTDNRLMTLGWSLPVGVFFIVYAIILSRKKDNQE